MSFKESEFPDLIKKVHALCESFEDASISKEILDEIVALYNQIPIYPGIVSMCISNYLKKSETLQKGAKVFLKLSDGYVIGKFDKEENGKIFLKDAVRLQKQKKITLDKEEVKEAVEIKSDTLRTTWPTLFFEEEK